jgi:hypothetical protein
MKKEVSVASRLSRDLERERRFEDEAHIRWLDHRVVVVGIFIGSGV